MRAGHEQAAARDREHHVGLVAARVHHLGERARAVAELLPGQLLALGKRLGHREILAIAVAAARRG